MNKDWTELILNVSPALSKTVPFLIQTQNLKWPLNPISCNPFLPSPIFDKWSARAFQSLCNKVHRCEAHSVRLVCHLYLTRLFFSIFGGVLPCHVCTTLKCRSRNQSLSGLWHYAFRTRTRLDVCKPLHGVPLHGTEPQRRIQHQGGGGGGGVPPSSYSSSSASTCEKDFASLDIQSLNTPLRNVPLNGLCFIQFLVLYNNG